MFFVFVSRCQRFKDGRLGSETWLLKYSGTFLDEANRVREVMRGRDWLCERGDP